MLGHQMPRVNASLSGVFAVLGSILLLVLQGYAALMSARGLDLTDEGFYLNSIVWAEHYKFGVSSFGDFFAIYFYLFDSNWPAFRLATILTNWLLWVVLGLLSVKLVANLWMKSFHWTVWIFFSLGSGAFSLLVLNIWLLTPSYNTLAFQAVTIFVCGLIASRIWGPIGIPVIGFGLFLSFVAKPTTAVALVVILALVNLKRSRTAILSIVGSGAVSLGLLIAWAIYLDGSVLDYINRLAVGLRFASLLDGGQIVWGDAWASSLMNAFWPFAGLSFRQIAYIALAAFSLLALLLNILLTPANKPEARRALFVLGFGGFLLSMFLLFLSREPGYFGQITVVGLLAVLLAVVNGIAWRRGDSDFLNYSVLNSANVRLALGIGLTPLAFAFGTNNNYWQQSSAVGGMYFLSAALVVSFINSKHFAGRNSSSGVQLLSISAAMAVVAITVLGAMNFPYRQASTVFQMVPSNEVSGIYVDTDTKRFFEDLSNLRETSDFQSGAPLIDNTGASPTAVYVLGGLPLGSAWLIGGYPGSEGLAEAQLRLYSQQCLDSAWILDEPTSPRRVFGFDPEKFSLSPSNTYEAMGSVKNSLTGGTQILYRPTHNPLLDSRACSLDR
jgi:hypothetical protein